MPRYYAYIAYEYLPTNDSEHLAQFVYEILENSFHSERLRYVYFVAIFVSWGE